MANKFKTIHIFGFDSVQVITKTKNIQCKKSDVKVELDACIDEIWSKKPTDVTLTKEYGLVNIFFGAFADWKPKVESEKLYRTKYSDLNGSLFEALVDKMILLENNP